MVNAHNFQVLRRHEQHIVANKEMGMDFEQLQF